jgi:hypothetical protein
LGVEQEEKKKVEADEIKPVVVNRSPGLVLFLRKI